MYNTVIIDDEWWTLQGISKTFNFTEMCFDVVLKTTDSSKAFEFIVKENPDVVLTDIRMPVISGIDLIKRIREKGLNTEFIIISGYAEFSYAQEALRQGAYDYCLKPIKKTKANEILKGLAQHLANKKDRKELDISDTSNRKNVIYSDNGDFQKLLNYIEENFNQKIYLKDLSSKFGFNPNYACLLFNKYTNGTFSEYLTTIRMKKAVKLLKDSSLTIQQISDKTGYKDYYYFNKVFKKYYGFTPTEYRKGKVLMT